MTKMRKITVTVPTKLLERARASTGEGISETVRIGLRYLVLENLQPQLSPAALLELARQPLTNINL
jgi:hypothetical protein